MAAEQNMDPCVVETAPLCGLVQEFVTDWLKTRRSRRGQHGYQEGDIEVVSAYAWLEFDTGIPEKEIRKLRSPSRYPLAELRVADALTSSIGEPGMFYDGTLSVMPNPFAPPGAAAECCGGSEQSRRPPVEITPGSIVRASTTMQAVSTSLIPESFFAQLRSFAERDQLSARVPSR